MHFRAKIKNKSKTTKKNPPCYFQEYKLCVTLWLWNLEFEIVCDIVALAYITSRVKQCLRICPWDPVRIYEEKCFSNVQKNKCLDHNPFVIWELTALMKIFKNHILNCVHSQWKCIPIVNRSCQQMTLLSNSFPEPQTA